MTIEEAIENLEARKEHYELGWCCEELLESLDMGIKALKNQKSIIEELEKVKAEFEDKILLNQTVAIQIIDKHISELKGEDDETDN